jgi:hypothetical protein
MMKFLVFLAFIQSVVASLATPPLAVYYGWPSAVNGAGGSVPLAVQTFKEYSQVVFGAGLEDPSHGDHANLVAILADPDMAPVQSFGYIDSTLDLSVVQSKIDQWVATGVKGIFLDQFGYDFGLTRAKQNALVWSIHHASCSTVMSAFVNAWNPDDVFLSTVDPTHNPGGAAPLLDSDDWYLLESYQIINGAYQSESDWRVRSDKATAGRTALGVSLASVTTTDGSTFDQNKADYSYLSSVVDGLDSWGWGEQYFSASNALLPWIARAPVNGTYFTGALTQNGAVWERQTNVGIHIDTTAHTVSDLLD